MEKPHYLIIGAGPIGLLLARALNSKDQAANISICERDPHADFRGPGWSLAIY